MNKEIEIPEGYEARIEGNKVVLELKESEDERTRKWLIEMVEELRKANPTNAEHNGDCSEAIAYLEKHTESTWTEEDESFVTHILPRIINPGQWTFEQRDADKKYLIEFIKRQKRKFTKKEKPTEWSEADKGMLNCIIATLCEESHGGRETNEKMVAWLDDKRKSFSPRPHWKPSNVQMTALYDAIYKSTLPAALESLYEDLKKLM